MTPRTWARSAGGCLVLALFVAGAATAERTVAPSVEVLIGRLVGDSDREKVVGLLVQQGRPAVPALIDALADTSVLARQPKLFGADIRGAVVQVLRRIPDSGVSEDLEAALTHADPGTRRFAALALGWRGDHPDAVARLLRDRVPAVRAFAALALRWSRDRSVASAVAVSLHDSTAEVRKQAAITLAALDAAGECAALTEALADTDSSVMAATALAVARGHCTSGIPVLRRLLKDGVPAAQAWAAWALAALPDPAAMSLVAERLLNGTPRARVAAALSLGEYTDVSGSAALVSALGDADASVQCAALWSLQRRRDRSAVGAIVPLLDVSDRGVGRRALFALRAITGEAIGFTADGVESAKRSRQRWQAWLKKPSPAQHRVLPRRPDARLLVIGDSISVEPSYVSALSGRLGRLAVHNVSLNGSTSEHWTPDHTPVRSVFWSAPVSPLNAALADPGTRRVLRPGAIAVIALGTNDILTDVTPAEFGLHMVMIVDALSARGLTPAVPFIPTPVGLTAPYNAVVRILWNSYPECIPGPDLESLFAGDQRLLRDLLHPNRAGHERTAAAWADVLRSRLPKS